jgi:hypothetical protein
MQKCSTCGNEFRSHQCPICGGKALPSASQINRGLKNYPLLSLVGLFGYLAADHFYRTLDRNSIALISLCALFFPMILNVVSAVRRRLARDVKRLKAAYLFCGSALVILALLIAGNGALDNSTTRVVKSSILRKSITSGRYSTTHHLHIASWRPGKNTEDIAVIVSVYVRASVGQPIAVEVHDGLFGIPWYGQISLQ